MPYGSVVPTGTLHKMNACGCILVETSPSRCLASTLRMFVSGENTFLDFGGRLFVFVAFDIFK